jgi:hypothetical protein
MKNPYGIRNGKVSVSIYSVKMEDLIASALEYAKAKNTAVTIWSNDYRNFREKRYAHLEEVVLPDGRSTSPYIMRCDGGIWCEWGDEKKPKGRAEAKKSFDGAGPTFRHIYLGWETQPV